MRVSECGRAVAVFCSFLCRALLFEFLCGVLDMDFSLGYVCFSFTFSLISSGVNTFRLYFSHNVPTVLPLFPMWRQQLQRLVHIIIRGPMQGFGVPCASDRSASTSDKPP